MADRTIAQRELRITGSRNERQGQMALKLYW